MKKIFQILRATEHNPLRSGEKKKKAALVEGKVMVASLTLSRSAVYCNEDIICVLERTGEEEKKKKKKSLVA